MKDEKLTKKEIIKNLEMHIKHLKKKSTPDPKGVLLTINYGDTHGGLVAGDDESLINGFMQLMGKDADIIEIILSAVGTLASGLVNLAKEFEEI